MKATLNEEMMKLFRTISMYAWCLSDDDMANETSMFHCYVNDVLNYLSSGDASSSNIMTNEAEDPDNDYTKAKVMMVNTIEMIDGFKSYQDEVNNKANKKII